MFHPRSSRVAFPPARVLPSASTKRASPDSSTILELLKLPED